MLQRSQIIHKVIDNHAYLTDLDVSFYVSNNPDGENNDLYDYNGVINLLKALEKNTVVQKFTMSFVRLNDESVKAFANFLVNNKSVVAINLNIREVDVTEDAYNVLTTKLQHNDRLQHLKIAASINISSSNMNYFIAAMCKGLYKNKSLQKLSFIGIIGCGPERKITVECAKSIALLLQSNSALRVLDFRSNNFTLGSMQEIIEHGIYNNQTLREINLKDSNLELASVTQLADALKRSNIKVLELDHNCFVGRGFDDLGSIIENNILQELNLSSSNLTAEEAMSLFNALKQNTTLKTLILPSVAILQEGLQVLYESLMLNTGLQRIDMKEQIIRPADVPVVCRILEQNRYLKSIDLECAVSSGDDLLRIIDSVKNNKTLQRLYLGNANDGRRLAYMEAPASLVEIFKSHPSLRSITLDLPLKLDSLLKILEAIKDNKYLVDFILNGKNNLNRQSDDYNDKIAKTVTEILLNNKTIEKICLCSQVHLSSNGWSRVFEALRTNFYINNVTASTFSAQANSPGFPMWFEDWKEKINNERKKNLNFCWRIFCENIGGGIELKLQRFLQIHYFANVLELNDILLFYSLREEQRLSGEYIELRTKVVRNILNIDAPLSRTMRLGPLTVAMRLGHLDVCKALVSMGAKLPPNALDLANKSGKTNIAEWLKPDNQTKSVVFSRPNILPKEVVKKIGSFLKNGHTLVF
jgi:Ran GTPase-activating protein (RanGAP) involved in mRNA processing and transport